MDEVEIKAVIAKLKAADWDAGNISPEVSEMMRSVDIMSMLMQQTGSRDEDIRVDAAWIMDKIHQTYADERFLKSQVDAYVDQRTARRAELLRTTDIQGVIAQLYDADSSTRHLATERLGDLGDPVAVPYLIEALKDESRGLYQKAALALYEIAQDHDIPELFPYLTSDDVGLRVAAAYALGSKGGKNAVSGLIDLVQVGIKGDKTEYERARKELRLIGQPAVEELIEALDERDVMVSVLAIEVLVPIGDARALPHIVAAMGDEDDQVYEAATWGAGEFGEAAIPLLTDALKDDKPRLRANAAEALGEIGDITTTDDLVKLLNDDEAIVRNAALLALEKIGNMEVVQHILPLLKGAALDAHQQRTTASYAAQVLRERLSTPEGLAAVEAWKEENNNYGC